MKSLDDISLDIKTARKIIDVGALYFHYKDPKKLYVVEFVGCLENFLSHKFRGHFQFDSNNISNFHY